jgi:hypothetical protein
VNCGFVMTWSCIPTHSVSSFGRTSQCCILRKCDLLWRHFKYAPRRCAVRPCLSNHSGDGHGRYHQCDLVSAWCHTFLFAISMRLGGETVKSNNEEMQYSASPGTVIWHTHHWTYWPATSWKEIYYAFKSYREALEDFQKQLYDIDLRGKNQ